MLPKKKKFKKQKKLQFYRLKAFFNEMSRPEIAIHKKYHYRNKQHFQKIHNEFAEFSEGNFP